MLLSARTATDLTPYLDLSIIIAQLQEKEVFLLQEAVVNNKRLPLPLLSPS